MKYLQKQILALMLIPFSGIAWAKINITPVQLNKLSGEKQIQYDSKLRWDQRYNKSNYVYGKIPASFLAKNFTTLKPNSLVLDMGMGEGRNAVFLAKKGHRVLGVDISSVAIRKAQRLARENNVKIKPLLASLKKQDFPENHFDAIICFYYVDRELTKKIKSWLKPGGVLIYEAYTMKEYDKGKTQEPLEYFLRPQELLDMFTGMEVVKYEEPMDESRYRASIIVRKN